MYLPVSRLFWVSSLAYPNLLGTKGYVVVVVVLVNNVLFNIKQGTEISLERPWRRETMHSLVKEATGIDFNSFGDVESAKRAVRGLPGFEVGNNESTSLQACSSVGHVLNEVT
jgi:lysyl-tRNA synthetase class II